MKYAFLYIFMFTYVRVKTMIMQKVVESLVTFGITHDLLCGQIYHVYALGYSMHIPICI